MNCYQCTQYIYTDTLLHWAIQHNFCYLPADCSLGLCLRSPSLFGRLWLVRGVVSCSSFGLLSCVLAPRPFSLWIKNMYLQLCLLVSTNNSVTIIEEAVPNSENASFFNNLSTLILHENIDSNLITNLVIIKSCLHSGNTTPY